MVVPDESKARKLERLRGCGHSKLEALAAGMAGENFLVTVSLMQKDFLELWDNPG
jgi:hypothetical protein